MSDLSHLDPSGRVRMVDVSGKDITERTAVAEGFLRATPDTVRRIVENQLPKGDFRPAVQLAAIAGAKRAADLIPLCHPLPLDHLAVEVETDVDAGWVRVVASATARARTGVEMEALTAVSVGLLTIYDMCKAVDRGMSIGEIEVTGKTGGKSDKGKEVRSP